MLTLTAKAVLAARSKIDPIFLASPIVRPAALSRDLDMELLLKDETVNPIGSSRGAAQACWSDPIRRGPTSSAVRQAISGKPWPGPRKRMAAA